MIEAPYPKDDMQKDIFPKFKKVGTLGFYLKQNSVHLVNVNHSFKDFIQQVGVIFDSFIKKFSLQVKSSIGGDVLETSLNLQLLIVGDLTIIINCSIEDCGNALKSSGDQVHYHVFEIILLDN